MQSAAAYSMSQPIAVTARRGSLLAYLRAGSLSIWMFSLVWQFWAIVDWDALQEQFREGSDIKRDFLIGFAVCLAAHLTLGITAWITAPFKILSTWSGRLFTAFCALTFVLSPISLVFLTTAFYALGTWGVYLLLYLYWQSDYRTVQRMLVVAGWVVLAWLFLLAFKNGLQLGLGIGGVNRNTTAAAALGGMICCMTSPMKSIRWAAIVAGAFMAVSVNSRGTIVAMAVFFVVYHTCYKGTWRAAIHVSLAAVLAAAIMVAVPALNKILFERILMLHDSARGIGNGFSGRVEAWKQAFASFWDNPIFGVGFRATTHHTHGEYGSIHSGYLKILVETGFVGAFLVIGATLTEAVRRFRFAIRFRNMPEQAAPTVDIPNTTRINAVACGTIFMMLAFWVYEQTYINIGNAIAIVFFLMMVAPTYITKQGETVR